MLLAPFPGLLLKVLILAQHLGNHLAIGGTLLFVPDATGGFLQLLEYAVNLSVGLKKPFASTNGTKGGGPQFFGSRRNVLLANRIQDLFGIPHLFDHVFLNETVAFKIGKQTFQVRNGRLHRPSHRFLRAGLGEKITIDFFPGLEKASRKTNDCGDDRNDKRLVLHF